MFEEDKIKKEFDQKESKIGQKLTETTSKKIIMIVLIIMISIPIFNLDTYVSEYNYFQSSIDTLHLIANQPNFALDNALFQENWDYLISRNDVFNAELVNLRLVKNLSSSEQTTVLKEYGSNSSLDNYRQYEFDGKSNQFSAPRPSKTRQTSRRRSCLRTWTSNLRMM